MIVRSIRTSIFRERQSLPQFLLRHLLRLRERSIVVVTSKIVALAEGRVQNCATERGRVKLIKSESQWAIKTKYTWLTIKDGTVMASAGIDQSNADGKCVLLPEDSYRSSASLRKFLMAQYAVRHLGVLITDSRLMPLREGVLGVALGYAGFQGIRDYRGKKDIFGRKLQMTQTNIADSLATAAVLIMGEGSEQRPLAVIQKAPVVFAHSVRRDALTIDPREDIYGPLFERFHGIRFPHCPGIG